MDYERKLVARIRSELPGELSKHEIVLKHCDGLYRHWRVAQPGTSNRMFNIVTWPGSLCFTGDMGDYLFQRVPDMVEFMQRSAMSFSYAEEKCVAHDGRLKEFSEEVFNEIIADRLKQAVEQADHDDDPDIVQHVESKIEEIRDEYECYSAEHDAIKAMFESGLWDGGDLPSCKSYTYHFLWCLHAIKWFCDRVQEPVPTENQCEAV